MKVLTSTPSFTRHAGVKSKRTAFERQGQLVSAQMRSCLFDYIIIGN